MNGEGECHNRLLCKLPPPLRGRARVGGGTVTTEHFFLDGATIKLLTPEGRVTVKLLRMKDEHRVQERQACIDAGLIN